MRQCDPNFDPAPPAGGKSHGISTDLTVGMPILRILKKIIFLISGTFGSFWDVAVENKQILWEGTI